MEKGQVIKIGARKIGIEHEPYIIAELSANHNGDINRAFAIMEHAKKAGADAVKIQTKSQTKIQTGLMGTPSLYT